VVAFDRMQYPDCYSDRTDTGIQTPLSFKKTTSKESGKNQHIIGCNQSVLFLVYKAIFPSTTTYQDIE